MPGQPGDGYDAASSPQPSKKRFGGVEIPTTLHQASALKAAVPAAVPTHGPQAADAAPIPLDAAEMEAILLELLLGSQKKSPVISAALGAAQTHVAENRWVLRVNSHVTKNVLQEWKPRLLAFLRERLANPSVVVEVELDETLADPTPTHLAGPKLREAMAEKNPHLELLIQLFGAQVDY